jgi:hypothetical protein
VTLLTAHKVMIATAVAFCAGFAVREVVLFARGGAAVDLALGAAAGVGAIALVVYLRWLLRTKGRRLAPAAKRRSS